MSVLYDYLFILFSHFLHFELKNFQHWSCVAVHVCVVWWSFHFFFLIFYILNWRIFHNHFFIAVHVCVLWWSFHIFFLIFYISELKDFQHWSFVAVHVCVVWWSLIYPCMFLCSLRSSTPRTRIGILTSKSSGRKWTRWSDFNAKHQGACL